MMLNPKTLAETQSLLWQLITAPEGVPDVPLPIVGDDRLSARDRLNIYANMYFYRIRDALKEDFPLLLAELGEDGFHNLITEYLVAHPPTHYSLRYAGQHLAGFIEQPPLLCKEGLGEVERSTPPGPQADRPPLTKGRNFLSNLARFEWALVTAFDAADAPLLTESDLQKIPAGDWPALVLKLHPSVQLLPHEFIVVWRQNFDVVHLSVPQEEWQLLNAVHQGADFASLCTQSSAEKITTHLRHWLTLGLLRSPPQCFS